MSAIDIVAPNEGGTTSESKLLDRYLGHRDRSSQQRAFLAVFTQSALVRVPPRNGRNLYDLFAARSSTITVGVSRTRH